jgi:AcrR family transcriptional regulator
MADQTRDKLIRAAERLMADRGLDAVTFAEITQAAGQRNNSAVPYHFGDRRGLVRAVLAKHTAPIAARRTEMLDELGSRATLRELVAALVRPIVMEVEHAEGGTDYVQVMAHMLSHPELDAAELGERPVARRLGRLIEEAVPQLPPSVHNTRMDLVMSVLFHGLADHARSLLDESADPLQRQIFVENLIDSIEALLVAPPSAATAQLLDQSRAPVD